MANSSTEDIISKSKDLLVKLINDNGAMKITNLEKIINKAFHLKNLDISIDSIDVAVIVKLCCDERLVEFLTYTSPNSSCGKETIFFPKGTIININREAE